MLELYHWEPNTVFLKPLIALAEKQVEFRSHYFDASRFEQFANDFPANTESRLQLEREGPLLLDGGAVISSSFFQLEYIAESCAGVELMPRDPHARFRMRSLAQVLALSVGGAVTTLGCARYLTPALRARPEAPLRTQIAAIEPLERRAAWEAVLEGVPDGALNAARERLALPLRRIEAALAASPWLAGADYSIADIDAFAMLAPLPSLAPGLVNASATPQLLAFLERVHARTAVRAALAHSRTGRPAEAYVPGAEAPRWG